MTPKSPQDYTCGRDIPKPLHNETTAVARHTTSSKTPRGSRATTFGSRGTLPPYRVPSLTDGSNLKGNVRFVRHQIDAPSDIVASCNFDTLGGVSNFAKDTYRPTIVQFTYHYCIRFDVTVCQESKA
jgi:hypothetical protein